MILLCTKTAACRTFNIILYVCKNRPKIQNNILAYYRALCFMHPARGDCRFRFFRPARFQATDTLYTRKTSPKHARPYVNRFAAGRVSRLLKELLPLQRRRRRRLKYFPVRFPVVFNTCHKINLSNARTTVQPCGAHHRSGHHIVSV